MPKNRNIFLGVNVDHIATLRQARGTAYPDPIYAAFLSEEGGADGITLHLREDRRHIQERDVRLLRETLNTRMNLEIAAIENMLAFAEEVRPAHCCLVPERREELTTEGGLDIAKQPKFYQEICVRLAKADIQVSLFIDPDKAQIDAALEAGAPVIEIHTGHYANAPLNTQKMIRDHIAEIAHYAHRRGLIVNAGHGLNYQNVGAIAEIPEINELNIGHAIIAQACFVGLKQAVRDMKALMWKARA